MRDKPLIFLFGGMELHGDTLSIRAKSKEEAVKKAKAIIERQRPWLRITPTCRQGEYGVMKTNEPEWNSL